jgi:hypothetical protein
VAWNLSTFVAITKFSERGSRAEEMCVGVHVKRPLSLSEQWIYANHIENTTSDIGSIVVFTAPLHSNGSYPIVACVFVAAGMCLPSRSLATGLHVAIRRLHIQTPRNELHGVINK